MKTTYNLIQRETRIGCFLEQLAYQRLPFGRVTLIPPVEKNNDRRAGLDGRHASTATLAAMIATR
jgi:hypothetical protein